MGRIKDVLHDMQYKKEEGINWVQMKQNEIVNICNGRNALMYNDLININEIKDNDKIYIESGNQTNHSFYGRDIVMVSNVCIKYEEIITTDTHIVRRVRSVPLDKVLYLSVSHIVSKVDK